MKQSYSPEAEKELRRTLLEFHEGRLVVGDKSKIRVTSLRQAERGRGERKSRRCPRKNGAPSRGSGIEGKGNRRDKPGGSLVTKRAAGFIPAVRLNCATDRRLSRLLRG
jgi:hypothetical protein